MADRDVYSTVDRGAGRGTTTIAWVALLLSLLALGLAFYAASQVSNIDERIQQGVESAAQNVEEGAQNAEEAVDAGPDGVDEDDTETTTPSTNGTDTTTDPSTTDTTQ